MNTLVLLMSALSLGAAEDWTGSGTCLTCHRDNHRSWQATYHSRMTQWSAPSTVQGEFDGQIVEYFGQKVRLEREGDRYFMSQLDDQERMIKRLPVIRTTGSHRYQQYFTQDDQAGTGNYWRLPLLWLTGERRWTHMNAVFLGKDDQDFNAHLTLWNQNCIFCHTTGPVPGETNLEELSQRLAAGQTIDYRYAPRYQSTQTELGIACESCHGPGAEHARLNRNPIRRYRLHFSDEPDPSIIHPERLPSDRSAAVCGQCHAQRVPLNPQDIRVWLDTGPTFRAGDRLEDHVRPIRADLPEFAHRFWADGVPRLSAYEYQGLTASACFESEALDCDSCHSGHSGRPEGMIEDHSLGNQVCSSCHQHIAQNLTAHTGHAPESTGSLCYNCHMPKIVYGVMTLHRSHRIEVPDPGRQARDQRPDACSNCHVDRTLDWAIRAAGAEPATDRVPRSEATSAARLIENYLSGDPVQRAVSLYHLGQYDNGDDAADRAFAVPFLLHALVDQYPMIRWFSRLALLKMAELDPGLGTQLGLSALIEWDYIGPIDQRDAIREDLNRRWREIDKRGFDLTAGGPYLTANGQLQMPLIEPRLAERDGKEIDIGE